MEFRRYPNLESRSDGMKKLVILFFLFLGGVCVVDKKQVFADEHNSKSSIYFTETYIHTPEEQDNGVTPTGNPPSENNQLLPQTGENNKKWLQTSGFLFVVISCFINNYRKKELKNEIN